MSYVSNGDKEHLAVNITLKVKDYLKQDGKDISAHDIDTILKAVCSALNESQGKGKDLYDLGVKDTIRWIAQPDNKYYGAEMGDSVPYIIYDNEIADFLKEVGVEKAGE